MSVSSTRKNFSASMAITSLANLSPSLVESDCRKFNHSRQAAAIKFARQSIANGAAIFARFTSSGRKLGSAEDNAAFWTSDIALLHRSNNGPQSGPRHD
jgi:hypothetical protein